MTDQQILQKAIKKAVKNGWDNKHEWYPGEFNVHRMYFSHAFAKAFWGEKEERIEHVYAYDKDTGGPIEAETYFEWLPAWQYHLQQMVLEEDPVKYLEKFL